MKTFMLIFSAIHVLHSAHLNCSSLSVSVCHFSLYRLHTAVVPWTSFIAFCIDGYLLCVLHFAQMNQTDAFLVATFIMWLTIVTALLALCACANLSFIKSNLIEFLWILTAFSLHIGRLFFFPPLCNNRARPLRGNKNSLLWIQKLCNPLM